MRVTKSLGDIATLKLTFGDTNTSEYSTHFQEELQHTFNAAFGLLNKGNMSGCGDGSGCSPVKKILNGVALITNTAIINEELEPELIMKRIEVKVKRFREEVRFQKGENGEWVGLSKKDREVFEGP